MHDYKTREIGPGTTYESFGRPRIPLIGMGEKYNANVWSSKPSNPWKTAVILTTAFIGVAFAMPVLAEVIKYATHR